MNAKKILTIIPVLALSLTSCLDKELNTDVYGVTEKEYNTGGLSVGSPFMSLQTKVIPIGSPSETTGPGNDLQATDLISSGAYVGYFGNNNNWNGTIEATWNFPDNRMSYIYSILYTKTYTPWLEIKQMADKAETPKEKEAFAMAEIVKVLTWLRATDAFGPLPYSEAGSGNITPKMDSQQKVYELMLADLEKAVETLRLASGKTLEKYDLVYDGDTQKWIKLANSIMLRMAVRSHFVAPQLAAKYVAMATDPAKGGLIESVEDEAKIGNSSKYPLRNPMIASVMEYNETRMGATIWAYLVGYNDNRITKYFMERDDSQYWYSGKYLPIAPANPLPKGNASIANKPRVVPDDSMYWLRASEVQFLLAEAALYGLMSGNPQDHYEEGVKLSFQEHGVSGVDAYLAQASTTLPGLNNNNYYFNDWMNDIYYACDISEGNVSPKWNNGDSQEKKLQKIITQKFLALYPNGIEAWTEYRRTGYPFIMKPMDPSVQQNIESPNSLAPERFKFASTEYSQNPNMSEVPALLGGPDTGATKLWWVRPNRPMQP